MMKSRRFIIAVLAIVCLTALGYFKGTDVALSIASIAIGIAGSNAYEGAKPKSPFKSNE